MDEIETVFTNIFLFSFEQVIEGLVAEQEFLKCEKGEEKVAVRISEVAPDFWFLGLAPIIPSAELDIGPMLGQGGYAAVHKSKWNDVVVAVKKFFLEVEDPEQQPSGKISVEIFNLFFREAETMVQLRHPNLTLLHGVCFSPLALVMQFARYGSLDGLLRDERVAMREGRPSQLSWALRMKIALDICSGMVFLHSLNPPIVHRDLKSPNVLVTSLDPQSVVAQVADFGTSARLLHNVKGRQTFCPYWIAPEILENKDAEYNHFVDVYAFGIILWELITAEEPFSEFDDRFVNSPTVVFEEAVVAGLRPTLPQQCPHLLRHVIFSSWATSPSQRLAFSDLLALLIQLQIPS